MNSWRGTPIKCANCQDASAKLEDFSLFCSFGCQKEYARKRRTANRPKQYKMSK